MRTCALSTCVWAGHGLVRFCRGDSAGSDKLVELLGGAEESAARDVVYQRVEAVEVDACCGVTVEIDAHGREGSGPSSSAAVARASPTLCLTEGKQISGPKSTCAVRVQEEEELCRQGLSREWGNCLREGRWFGGHR